MGKPPVNLNQWSEQTLKQIDPNVSLAVVMSMVRYPNLYRCRGH